MKMLTPQLNQGSAPKITITASSWSSRASTASEVDRLGWTSRVWPLVERTMTTLKDYPVVLYDEV